MRDVQLKGLRHSTDRALVNCSSGKYLNSSIKLESHDSKLARLGSVGYMSRRAYRINTASEYNLVTQRVRRDFLHACGHGNYRVNAAGASPGRLDGSAGLIFTPWVQHPRIICGVRISGSLFSTALVVNFCMGLSSRVDNLLRPERRSTRKSMRCGQGKFVVAWRTGVDAAE